MDLSITVIFNFTIFKFTEPFNLHWLDVRENYFKAYREHLSDFFRSLLGYIFEYDEIRPCSIYKEPYYDEHQTHHIDKEAWKYLFFSTEDYHKVRRKLQGFNRSLSAVSKFSFNLNNL